MPSVTPRTGNALETQAEALIVPLYAGDAPPADLEARFGGQLARTLSSARMRGAKGDVAVYPTFGNLPARWLALTGLGAQGAADAEEALRRAYGAAGRKARDAGARTLAATLPAGATLAQARAALEGLLLGLYRFTRYKSAAALADLPEVEHVELWGTDESLLQEALRLAHATSQGVSLARDLVNTISADKPPAQVAALAEQLARESEFEFRALDRAALEAGGYNAIVAVGKGSVEEPRLVELIYSPPGTPARTVALVGKTMTFDAGGLDLKTATGMASMKNDLGGGAAVLGVMRALAELQPNVRVIAVLAAAENMPSGSAMHPFDVVKALNGVTFEIANTDAEGRMVLADGITHAARAGADEIISVATLTGGVLGRWGTVALSNDDDLRDRFVATADAAGERVWPLPLWEEFKEDLQSEIADLRSVGTDWGGDTIRAAVFISHFTEGKPWLHLDIAMVADSEREHPYTPKGATGVMVRSLLRYLEELGR